MAAPSRHPDPHLGEDSLAAALLGGHEYRFGFFQAVRILDLLFAARAEGRVGYNDDPSLAAARFLARASLAFPASELYALGCDPEDPQDFDRVRRQPRRLDWRRPRRPVPVTVNFMGLTGPQGVLPLHYSELVMARQRQGDFVLREFLDLFNNRLIAFFYRAWSKHRVGIQYEWSHARAGVTAPSGAVPGEDAFSRYLSCLMGLGTPGLSGRLAVADESLRYYTASFAARRRSATTLREIIADYLQLPATEVTVRQFIPQWLPLPRSGQSDLGVQNFALGVDTVIGDEVIIENAKFEIDLGPLVIERFLTLLPNHNPRSPGTFQQLVHLARLFVGPELDFDVRLILRADQIYVCQLGESGDRVPRLGVSTWVLDQTPERDLQDSVFPSGIAE